MPLSGEDVAPVGIDLARRIRDAGGRAFVTGGAVRDRLFALGRGEPVPAQDDLDFEVYGLPLGTLSRIGTELGRLDRHGEGFGILRVHRDDDPKTIDLGLPRRETKIGRGHRGFKIEPDAAMRPEEAVRRRDFTVNALLWDPLTGDLLDPTGGIPDLDAGILRAVSPSTFAEDSLRALRALHFAARFELTPEPATREICAAMPLDDLSPERVGAEIQKLLLLARRPSLGFSLALELGVIEKLFPELQCLVGCPQEPEWHPEGDVWVHTLQVIDRARMMIDDLDLPRRLSVMYGALCHDLGKPGTTSVQRGRIRSLDHDTQGVLPTERLLDRVALHSVDGHDVRSETRALVQEHLRPGQFFEAKDTIRKSAFKRLAERVDPELLYRVAKADALGRVAAGKPEPDASAQEWFRDEMRTLAEEPRRQERLLTGDDLILLGVAKGPRIGRILAAVRDLETDGKIVTKEEAVAAARTLMGEDG